MYSKQIKEKKFPWGGRAVASAFPSKGVVSIVGSIAGGSRAWESEEEADVAAEMLLEGTTKHDKKELQRMLDSMGASLFFNSGSERLYFTAKAQPKHAAKLLALVAECLLMPAFPEPELAVLKTREASNLEMESQNTYAQALTALSRIVFKPEHPNYGETTAESKKIIKSVTTKNLRQKHAALLDRSSLIISLAGDITPKKAFALVDAHFKQLPKKGLKTKPFKKASITPSKKTFIPIKNKASIDYVTGIATGITNTSPDYPALLLGLQALGNRGFASRLMKTVREEEGLTYGVYAFLAGTKAHTDGYLYIWATFAPQLYEKGKESIARQVRLLLSEGVTEEEIRKHGQLFEARNRVQLSNSGAYAKAAHDCIADGKKLSYLDEFPKKIKKLGAKEVNRVLKKYLLQSKFSEAAAGTK